MKRLLFAVAAATALGIATFSAQGQAPAQPARPASADPYANNPDAGKQQFPLAAPAGKDSNAKQTSPAGAQNQGPFDPSTWKYGTAFAPPAGAKIWNPPINPVTATKMVVGLMSGQVTLAKVLQGDAPSSCATS